MRTKPEMFRGNKEPEWGSPRQPGESLGSGPGLDTEPVGDPSQLIPTPWASLSFCKEGIRSDPGVDLGWLPPSPPSSPLPEAHWDQLT